LREQLSFACFNLKKIDGKLRATYNQCDIVLNDDQIDDVMGCLKQKITMITGSPGTGKTTLIRKFL